MPSNDATTIAYPTDAPEIRFGVDRLLDALDRVRVRDLGDVGGGDDVDVVIATDESALSDAWGLAVPSLAAEGFRIARGEGVIGVLAPDASGAMYGTMELAETVRLRGDLDRVPESQSEPEVEFRAIKFNLPWSAYHGGQQTEIHVDTCRDLDFWESFLDMMAENRFNALTLWNLHPFPFMVRVDGFEDACPFSEDEFEEWRAFWHGLFEMADDRGIDTYVVNWNILVSPAFADSRGVQEANDTSDLVREYTREHVRAVVDEYPNLTGLGVSLCDWMEGMSPAEKQDWLEETILAGIEEAERSVNFLDRSVLTESIEEMRRGIDTAASIDNVEDIYVPTKFNWSHGHSTTRLELTHDYSSGEVDDSLWNPEPEHYDIAWTIRNEDFFVLRWGQPDFVRKHLIDNNHDYVGGYVVGSEIKTPAVDDSHRPHAHETWDYLFEKHWLFYTIWGRLLYDPDTSDRVFEAAFERRYGEGIGERMLEGYRHASRMPLEFAAFHAGRWDYTLYSEGFCATVEEAFGLDDGVSPFVSVDELIDHRTLDSTYLSIPEYLDREAKLEEDDDEESGGTLGEDGPVTPLDVADRMDEASERALGIAESVREEFESYTGALIEDGESRGARGESAHNEYPGALECELDDMEAWGHLASYFAAKLRGGVHLERYRREGHSADRENAIEYLELARECWDDVIDATEHHYREVPYADDWIEGNTFSWATYRDQVERDVRIAREAEYEG